MLILGKSFTRFGYEKRHVFSQFPVRTTFQILVLVVASLPCGLSGFRATSNTFPVEQATKWLTQFLYQQKGTNIINNNNNKNKSSNRRYIVSIKFYHLLGRVTFTSSSSSTASWLRGLLHWLPCRSDVSFVGFTTNYWRALQRAIASPLYRRDWHCNRFYQHALLGLSL